MRAREIELDMLSGNFDQSLQKYKPQAAINAIASASPTENVPTLIEIWTSYLEDKASSLKPTTKGYHKSFTKLFEHIGDIPLVDSLKVKKALEKITTVHQTKRASTQLNAACRWANKHKLIDSMPYEGMAKDLPQYVYQLEPSPMHSLSRNGKKSLRRLGITRSTGTGEATQVTVTPTTHHLSSFIAYRLSP